jgi:hypothetical protein
MIEHLLALGVLVLGNLAASDRLIAQQKQPGPEHQRLQFFVGQWRSEADIKASEFGAAGKETATQTCEWFDGRFHIICRTDATSPGGSNKQIEVLTYDSNRQAYTRYNMGSFGESVLATGTLDGKTWRWRDESKTKGKVIRVDFPWTETSPDSYTFKIEMSIDGGPATTIAEGKATRVK